MRDGRRTKPGRASTALTAPLLVTSSTADLFPGALRARRAVAVNADALVTHDRDFSRVRSLRIIT